MEEPRLIAQHDVFDHLRGRDAGKVAAARGHGEREGEPDDVVGGIADDRLVEVADFDFDAAIGAGYGAEIADVAVAADPDGGLGDRVFCGRGQATRRTGWCCRGHRRGRCAPSCDGAAARGRAAILEGDGLVFGFFVGTQIWMRPGVRAAAAIRISSLGKRRYVARLAVFAIEKIAHGVAAGGVGFAVGGGGGMLRDQLGGFGVEQVGQRLA
jgi:hypothetical protein